MINNHKASGEWKIQLVILNRCISSKNYEETRDIHYTSDNIEIFMGSNTDEVIDRLFNSMLQRFKEANETSFERGSEFFFENVDSLYYYFQKTDINRSGSYVDSPDLLKHKKATINLKNKDNECFKYAVPVALNHQSVKNHPERFIKNETFYY